MSSVTMENIAVGIIGMGEMGKMYARRLSAAGWRYDLSLQLACWTVTVVSLPSRLFISTTFVYDDLSAFGSSMASRHAKAPFWCLCNAAKSSMM